MIQQAISIRKEFRETVKNYCLANNIRWSVVYSECWHEGVIGTPEEIKMVESFVNTLEKEYRRNKSLLWKLFN